MYSSYRSLDKKKIIQVPQRSENCMGSILCFGGGGGKWANATVIIDEAIQTQHMECAGEPSEGQFVTLKINKFIPSFLSSLDFILKVYWKIIGACLSPKAKIFWVRSLEKGHSVKELFPVYFPQGKVEMGGREGRKIVPLLYSPYLCMIF